MRGPRFIFLLIVLIGFAPLAEVAYADGWPQRRGHGYYKIGFRWVRASQFYEPGGTQITIPTLSDYTVSFYGEYGITDRLTAIAYVPFFERITLNKQVGPAVGSGTERFVFFEGDAVSGIADPEVGIRFGLLQGGSTVLSLGVKLGVPIGSDQQENGLLTGDGEINQKVSLEAGHSFWPVPAYVLASAGYNNRLNGYSDEFIYRVEGGYTFAKAFTLIARVQGVESMENGDDAVTGGMGGLYANNQRYLAYGAEFIYTRNDSYGVSLSVDGATRARNVLSAPAFSVGIFLKR